MNAATFYGVGLGPGDPELMTRKAARVLAEVACIFVPASGRSGTSFARRIVAPLNLPQEKFREVALCMDRDRREDQRSYEQTADAIAQELSQGRSAAWITEGDPLFYSTFIHVYAQVRRRHPQAKIEIVPGVTSLQAACACAGMAAAQLDDSVAVVPAAYGLGRLPGLLREFTTVFLLKVHSVFDELLDRLQSLPSDVTAIYLENVGTPAERIVSDLRRLRGAKLPYFSLVMLHAARREDAAAVATATAGDEP